MKKLAKYLIITLSSLLVLLIVIMALSPKNMVVEKSIKINAPANYCFNLVNDLSKWELWSPWNKLDPEAVHSYSDIPYGAGAKWTWKGNDKIGEGSQTIIESNDNSSIKMALEFNGWDGESMSNWNFVEKDGKTEVSWDFQGSDTPFLFRPFNLIMKGGLGNSYKEGLKDIKKLVEERYEAGKYRGFEITQQDMDERYFLMKRSIVSFDNIQQFYAQNLGSLFAKVQSSGLEMKGMPCGLYFSYDEISQKTDMAAAIPINADADVEGVLSHTIPAGRAVQLDYLGDYEGLGNAHVAIDEYMKDRALFSNPPVVEEYITDPGQEEDPNKWLTRISYYIPSI